MVNVTMILGLFGLVYTFIIVVIFFNKKKINKAENRVFSKILITTLIAMILEALLTPFVKSGNALLIEIGLKSFHSSIIFWIWLFGLYTFVISHNKKTPNDNYKEKYKTVYNLYKVFGVISVLCALLFRVDLRSYNNNYFSSGPSTSVVFIFSTILIIIMLFFLIKSINKENKKSFIPVIVFVILMGLVAIIQNKHPDILLVNALFGIISFVMFLTIENPDLKLIKELEYAKDVANESNRAKSDFLSSMSHEIRTPLNAIIGLSELNNSETEITKIKENSKDILIASKILLEIVGNVLDMSKIEAGSMEIIAKDYDALETFESVINVIDYKVKEKNLKLNVHISKDLPQMLTGDPKNLKKVLINLLSNAVKYTKEGEIAFTINNVVKDNVCRLIISVEDTGIGIKPENLEKLFSKFERIDQEKNTTTEGTGLGLAITKQLLEMMNGHLTVHSVFGKGSKFTVKIDQLIPETDTESTYLKNEPAPTLAVCVNKKILLVDDNEMNLKVAKRFLETYSCRIDTALSAKEGYELLKNNEYDLLLIDEMMPKISGTEMMRELKLRGLKVPIVVLTADVVDNAKEKFISAGFDDYLGKPIDTNLLEGVLLKFLK